jgi:RNA polymerase sigma-70 factor (ECF subfamily)
MTSVVALGGLMAVVDDQRSRADLAMERYADGDDAAFEMVYDELEPGLRRFAERETRSRSAADDVVQQTFERLIRHRARYLRGAAVRSWAWAIARRLLIDRHRAGGHEVRWPPGAPGDGDQRGPPPGEALPDGRPAPDDALDLRRREAALQAVLVTLPPRHREAFRLTKVFDLSVAEAAEVLGLTAGNVRICVHRALEALRQADAERWEEEP